MAIEDFFNQNTIVDLSFFNFRNSVTAAYFANDKLEVQKVNDNFRSFFPILGNVTNVYFPDVLEQLGVSGEQIDEFVLKIEKEAHQRENASLSRTLDHIEVNVLDSSDIPAAMRELKQIQEELEEQIGNASQKERDEA